MSTSLSSVSPLTTLRRLRYAQSYWSDAFRPNTPSFQYSITPYFCLRRRGATVGLRAGLDAEFQLAAGTVVVDEHGLAVLDLAFE